jgi:fructose-1,6-bisphosphatase I
MVSEEDEEIIVVSDNDRDPKGASYAVVFDPLDGSSNIEAGVSIGTIFGIYRIQQGSKGNSVSDVLRKGSEMICAGYCMYGSSTNLVMSTGGGIVNGYTLDTTIGEFILTHPNIRVPKRGKIYSINEGNSVFWDAACIEYFESLKKKTVDGKHSPYSARYVGSMVADVHRTLLYGGIFAYPADSKSKSGKLRVLYECFPMAYLLENAGGKASTGFSAILDLLPTEIHQRAPIFLGSSDDVADLEQMYRKHKKP